MKVRITEEDIYASGCSIIHANVEFRIYGSLLGYLFPYVKLYSNKETTKISLHNGKGGGIIKINYENRNLKNAT
jgi:hypothetical protein